MAESSLGQPGDVEVTKQDAGRSHYPGQYATMTSARDVRDALGLVSLPKEGGWWAQTYLDEVSSATYYLLAAGEHSSFIDYMAARSTTITREHRWIYL